MKVLFWGRQGSYIGWSICDCILGSVLAVLGWRYWAGGRPGGVGAVAREGVEAVVAGSDCWEGCGGLYKFSCYSSLALVNEGEASGACADGACADGACVDGACADGACTDGACGNGACADRVCVGRVCAGGACTGGACVDGACVDGACAGGAFADGACVDGACVGGACADGAFMDGAFTDRACDIVYGKSPGVPSGSGGFVYIEGPIRPEILLSLNEVKNPLVLIWSRISSLVYSVWSSLHSILYKDCIIVTRLLTHTP